jgi:hypothetical protein
MIEKEKKMERCPKCTGEDDNCDRCDGLGVIDVPTTIYLQIDYDIDEITWCVDKIYDNDLEYTLVPPNKPFVPTDNVDFSRRVVFPPRPWQRHNGGR